MVVVFNIYINKIAPYHHYLEAREVYTLLLGEITRFKRGSIKVMNRRGLSATVPSTYL
jgi:hypothetical protein